MSYLYKQLQGQTLMDTAKKALEKVKGVHFDALAVRGVSGLLVGSVMAALADKQLIVVRKDTENSHGELVEGWGKDQKILIVDDFIETGNTMDCIQEALMGNCDNPEIIGILLYASTHKQEDLETFALRWPDGIIPVYCIYRYELRNENKTQVIPVKN